MNILKGIAFRHLFTVVCIIGATIMVGYWFYKFDVEDRDIGVVDFIPLKDIPESDIPVPNLCFLNPFLPERLLEIPEYIKYMKGDEFRNESADIKYGNVSLSLKDYFMFSQIKWRNGSVTTHGAVHILQNEIFNGWIAPNVFFKCFAISPNIQGRGKIWNFYSYFKRKEIMNDMQKGRLMKYWITMNYPGQFLLTPATLFVSRVQHNNLSSIVYVDDIEILKSRNSRNRKCTVVGDKKSFDDMILEKHIATKGCTAPYMKPDIGYPRCGTQDEIRSCIYSYDDVRNKYYASACQRMAKVRISFEYYNQYPKYPNYTEGILPTESFALGFKYPEYAKIITQSKEVDIHGLVGNIGGYVGLFLGNKNIQVTYF